MEHFPAFLKGKEVKLPEINSTTANAFISDLPFEDYLAREDAVSSTGIRAIIESPRDFLVTKTKKEEPQDYFRFGSAAHTAFLEPSRFKEKYRVMPAFTGFTKDGKPSTRSADVLKMKEDWLKSLPPDASHVTEEEVDNILGMAEAMSEHNVASNIMKNCATEMTGFFTDPETGILCKIRPDILYRDGDGLHLIDYKTTEFSDGYGKIITRLKYHVQIAFYYYGIKIITGEEPHMAGFLFQQKNLPFTPHLHICSDKMIEDGLRKVRHGLNTLKKCLETGKWPFARVDAQMVDIPDYVLEEPLPEFNFGQE